MSDGTKDWEKSLENYPGIILVNAHCDTRVLHSIEWGCEYCNQFPEAQQKRIELGINFTGCNEPYLKPCPADLARGDTHWEWQGNWPKGDSVPEELTEALEEIESASSKMMYGAWDKHDY